MEAAPEPSLTAHISRERAGPWFMFRGPGGFEWTKVRAPVPGLAKDLAGFRFVHLSDLHMRSYWSRGYDQLIERLEVARPDLVLVTGDFVDNKHDHRPGLGQLKKLLPRLRSRLGVYGILGNHDVDLLEGYLTDLGVTLLDGKRAVLESGGAGGGESASGKTPHPSPLPEYRERGKARVELIGLPGVARADLDSHFIAGQPVKEPGTLRIVLSHYPDQFPRVRPLRADFFLAGHTHGGQICLPGGRPIITHDRMTRCFCKGVHRMDETWYVVSRGLGFAGIPVRFCCPAEVAEITTIGVGET